MERRDAFRYIGAALFPGVVLSCLLSAHAPRCDAQQIHTLSPETVPYHLQYDDHLLSLQKTIPEWRAAVEQIDPGRLSVSYRVGRLIEQEKGPPLSDLKVASLLVSRIQASHRLSDEISLFGLLGDIDYGISALNNELMGPLVGNHNQHMVTAWSNQLEAIDGPLSKEQMFQLGAVTTFADSIQDLCTSPPASDTR